MDPSESMDETVPATPPPRTRTPSHKRQRGGQMSKRWSWTLNNPGDYNPAELNEADFDYMDWQTERGEEGTVHLQGYVRFKARKRLATVKAWFGRNEIHCEVSRGSEEENRNYCQKEDSRIDGSAGERGEYEKDEGKQGRRSDLATIAQKCAAGVSIKEIAEQHGPDFIRYHGGITALHDQVAPQPAVERVVNAFVFWGPTGVGKTHRVLTTYPRVYQVLGKGRGPWDRYTDQPVLLLDEFDWTKWSVQELNTILDKWRAPLDCRYHDKYAAWTMVFICCNDNPTSWFPNESVALRDSLRRRLAMSCRFISGRGASIGEIMIQVPEPNWDYAQQQAQPADQ